MLNTLVLNQDGQDFQDEGSVLCIWENVSSVPSDLDVYSTGRHSPSRVPTRRRARACPSSKPRPDET